MQGRKGPAGTADDGTHIVFFGASGGWPGVVLERCALGRGCRSVLAARLLPFLYFFLHRTGWCLGAWLQPQSCPLIQPEGGQLRVNTTFLTLWTSTIL